MAQLIMVARRFGAGIPHRPLEGRTVGVGGHVDEPETGSLRERRRETERDHNDEPGSMHRSVSWYAGRQAFTVEPSLQRLQRR
jgi:hypothetical protein